jgi:hypothetical protein
MEQRALQWALNYIERLEGATGWMFATRSYMVHPATDFDRSAFKLAETIVAMEVDEEALLSGCHHRTRPSRAGR